MFVTGDSIVYSASDLAAAARCQYALLREFDAKLGRGPAVAVDDELMARAAVLGSAHEGRRLDQLRHEFGDAVAIIGRPAYTPAGLAWVINLGCVDLNPHPVLAGDLDHPDELRVDLDPMPGVAWQRVVEVALVVREVLEDYGLTAWPKTSGSRGFHVYARIAPCWSFPQVRLAAQTVAREVERRLPDAATSRWWKEEREGVFVDFNQNAKDRTVASAYSVRATPDARVSTPLHWEEVPGCDPAVFTMATVPSRLADIGDPWAGMDDAVGRLDRLLMLAEELGPPQKAQSAKPLIEIARAKTRAEAMAALDIWRDRYPGAAALLRPADVLVDGMRGPSSIWYRIRINLQHVPADQRPPQEELIADYSPWPR